jgi:N6-L-threonylcarbamoyladenine synthase
MKDQYILGIESSCDETSAAVLKNGKEILSNIISTQIATHVQYGGVMPEIASRLHLENIAYVLDQCFLKAGIKPEQLDAVAVTGKPGLIGALHIGVLAAKTIACYYGIPLINVHHLAGHIYANEFAGDFHFPLLAIVASGGNSELVYMKDHLDFQIVGETMDDAIGESLDKVARVLGLPYPGGVAIDKLTKSHDFPLVKLPKVQVRGYNLSYSGLKSYLIRTIEEEKKANGGALSQERVCEYAFSAEKAFVDQLVGKALKAAEHYHVKQIIMGGGVSANTYLRQEIVRRGKGYEILIPPLWCTTDNAAMIAKAGAHMYEKKDFASLDFAPSASAELGHR